MLKEEAVLLEKKKQKKKKKTKRGFMVEGSKELNTLPSPSYVLPLSLYLTFVLLPFIIFFHFFFTYFSGNLDFFFL